MDKMERSTSVSYEKIVKSVQNYEDQQKLLAKTQTVRLLKTIIQSYMYSSLFGLNILK